MSKAQFLGSIDNLPDSSANYDKLTIGAAIIRSPKMSGGAQILLLQRNMDEEYYPGVYEIPGGKVDDQDATIAAAITREVSEETNLVVSRILNKLPVMTYTTEKNVSGQYGKEVSKVKRAIQLSYVVEVENDTMFCWNPAEHCHGVWASREDIRRLEITEDMKKIIEAALQ